MFHFVFFAGCCALSHVGSLNGKQGLLALFLPYLSAFILGVGMACSVRVAQIDDN